jgi:hypothetical protein
MCVCTAQEKIRDVFRITHCLVAEFVSSRHEVQKTYLSNEVVLIITKQYNRSSLPIRLLIFMNKDGVNKSPVVFVLHSSSYDFNVLSYLNAVKMLKL